MDDLTKVIRERLRERLNQEREDRRGEAVNSIRRALVPTNDNVTLISAAEIEKLAYKLKHKKINVQGLKTLKQAFIQSRDNIRIFMDVTGALHGLVREATGNRTQNRMEAIDCCCNLALGNDKVGARLAKAVGPYIVSQLDCYSPEFLDICLWTLGNLAASGRNTWLILKSQGVLPKLLQLSSVESVAGSAIYALTFYTKTGFRLLEEHELELIAMNASQLMVKEPSVYWLIFLLTCNEKCDAIMIKNHVVSNAFKCLQNLLKNDGCENAKKKVVDVTALLRIIGNLCGAQNSCFEQLIQGENRLEDLLYIFRSLLVFPFEHVRHESLWVIGNVVMHLTEPEIFISGLEPELSNVLKTVKCQSVLC